VQGSNALRFAWRAETGWYTEPKATGWHTFSKMLGDLFQYLCAVSPMVTGNLNVLAEVEIVSDIKPGKCS